MLNYLNNLSSDFVLALYDSQGGAILHDIQCLYALNLRHAFYFRSNKADVMDPHHFNWGTYLAIF